MAIEQEARQYVRVTGQGQPIIKRQTPSSSQKSDSQDVPLPPETALVREADMMASEQGYSEQGAAIGGKIVGYGSFSITLADGTRFTPRSKQDVVNVMVGELRGQYREQGEKYVSEGYTPVVDESGNIQYVKSERQLLSPDYVPQRGDVQQYPGGPIVNIPEATGTASVRQQVSQTIADMLGLSRMNQQEVYQHVESFGDTTYRQKLLDQEIAEEGISSQEAAMIPLYALQGAGFVGGARSLTAIVKEFPIISKIVSGGVKASSVLYSVGAVKQIVEEPSDTRRAYDIIVFAGMIGAGTKTGGMKLTDISSSIRARIKTVSAIFKEQLETPAQGFKIIDMESLVKRSYRPRTYQTTIGQGRYLWTKEGQILLERTRPPGKTYSIKDIVETAAEGKPKPLPTDTTTQTKLFTEIKTARSTPWDYKTRIAESKVMPLEEILRKISSESREKFIRGKTGTGTQKTIAQTTIDELTKGRGQRVWVDEKGNIRVEELERLSGKEQTARRYNLEDVTRKKLYDITRPTEEIKTDRTIFELEKRTKTPRTTEEIRSGSDSVDIFYAKPTSKLIGFLFEAETGVGDRSSHWDTIRPGPQDIIKRTSGRTRLSVFSDLTPGEITIQHGKSKQAQGEISIDKLLFGSVNASMEINDLFNSRRIHDEQNTRQMLMNRSILLTDTNRLQSSITSERTMLRTKQQLDKILVSDIVEELITETTPGKPRFRLLPEEEEGAGDVFRIDGDSGAYDVSVKRRGRFVTVGHSLSKNTGIARGIKETENTAACTFRLKPVSGKPRSDPEAEMKNFLKLSQYYTSRQGFSIEKNEFRINSPGELREITWKGIAARRRHGR